MVPLDEASYEVTALPGGAAVTTVRGAQPGPTLALLGGVHGDEDEGVLAVRRLVRELATASLTGTIRAVAPVNAAAWAAQGRTGPLDGLDLARCFPGDAAGGPTAALAAGVTGAVIDGADLLIDLHSAGRCYKMPLFCGFVRQGAGAGRSERAARAFGAPLVWAHADAAPGRTLSVAVDRGIPAIYAECSGGGGIRSQDLDAYVSGVQAVMAEFGMLPDSFRRPDEGSSRWVYDGGDLDAGVAARHDGFFVSTATAGDIVGDGEELGRMYGYDGALMEVVSASVKGMVMFLRRQARTRSGDVLFAMARLDEEGTP